jgi:hypothetical protein
VLPYLNAEMMQPFLDEFAGSHVTSGKRIVLVLDGATAHRAKALHVPERLTLVKEGIANRTHSTLETLEKEVCTTLSKNHYG